MDCFKDLVAVITGGGSGIGRAISLALSERGATVCLVGRRAHVLESVAETVHAAGGLAKTYSTDITSDEELRGLAMRVEQELGRVDILVHSAGAFFMGDLSKSSVRELDLQFRANVHAPLLLTQLLLPLLQSCHGQIVFVNSSVGLTTRPGVGQFSATQHALKAIADTLRAEINVTGVRVLSVYPGRTATPRMETIHLDEGRPYFPERLMQPEDVASIVIDALALKPSAEVTDIQIRPFVKFD